jgi:hypothetical protein
VDSVRSASHVVHTGGASGKGVHRKGASEEPGHCRGVSGNCNHFGRERRGAMCSAWQIQSTYTKRNKHQEGTRAWEGFVLPGKLRNRNPLTKKWCEEPVVRSNACKCSVGWGLQAVMVLRFALHEIIRSLGRPRWEYGRPREELNVIKDHWHTI